MRLGQVFEAQHLMTIPACICKPRPGMLSISGRSLHPSPLLRVTVPSQFDFELSFGRKWFLCLGQSCLFRIVYSRCLFHVVVSDDLTWPGPAFTVGSFGGRGSYSGVWIQKWRLFIPKKFFPNHPLCANIQLKTNQVFNPVKKY